MTASSWEHECVLQSPGMAGLFRRHKACYHWFLSCCENTFLKCVLLSQWVFGSLCRDPPGRKAGSFTFNSTPVSNFIHIICLSQSGMLKIKREIGAIEGLLFACLTERKLLFKKLVLGFPGGTVVKNPPANAGDTRSSPGPGRSHMPRSN